MDSLIEQGVNKIIALGHSGIEKDMEIAAKVRGVDVVVGGHTDTFLYTGKCIIRLYFSQINNDNSLPLQQRRQSKGEMWVL